MDKPRRTPTARPPAGAMASRASIPASNLPDRDPSASRTHPAASGTVCMETDGILQRHGLHVLPVRFAYPALKQSGWQSLKFLSPFHYLTVAPKRSSACLLPAGICSLCPCPCIAGAMQAMQMSLPASGGKGQSPAGGGGRGKGALKAKPRQASWHAFARPACGVRPGRSPWPGFRAGEQPKAG